jgi:glucose-6-phosphate isomerase
VHEELDKMFEFSEKVRNGQILGSTGKRIKTVLSIGIGGSYLGVLACYQAFRNTKQGYFSSRDYILKFLADPDPIDLHQQVDGLDPESTLVIILSKTFTTAETILNATTVKEWFIRSLQSIDASLSEEKIISSHFSAVSTDLVKTSKFGIEESRVFAFWDWVGGRFSVSSAIGVLPLSIVFGKSLVEEFLSGMRNIDENFKNEKNPLKNVSVLLGLIGFYNRTIQGFSSKAILPYNQGLSFFSNHIQQVSMESNGKRVNMQGEELAYGTGYVVFGDSGTKGQHSFY